MSKNKLSHPIKIFWEESDNVDDVVKDVLPNGKYHTPTKILNSTAVTIEAKPWLVKHKTPTVKDNDLITKKVEKKITVQGAQATLKDLCQKDKQKVANLIRELAKSGTDNDKTLKELEFLKNSFEEKLRKVHFEKEKAIKEQDFLKEKLLEYEVVLLEQKENDRHNKFSSQEKKNLSKDLDNTSDVSAADTFSEVFVEHQKKFFKQQEVLQLQIEQLQKLQESIIHQQAKESHDQHNASILRDSNDCSHVGANSKKLHSYISAEASKNQKIQQNKENTHPSPLRNEMSVHKRTCVEMAVQTENQLSNSLKESPQLEVKVNSQNRNLTISKSFSNPPSTSPPHITKESLPPSHNTLQSKGNGTQPDILKPAQRSYKTSQDKGKLFVKPQQPAYNGASSSTYSSRIKTLSTTFPDESSSSSGDENAARTVKTSALQRKHFQSSILEIVEGLQPRSASTSVDQHSVHKKFSSLSSSRTPPRRVLTGTNAELNRNLAKDSNMSEEQKILNDVFFL